MLVALGNNPWGNPNSSAFEAEDDEETQLQKVVQVYNF